MGNYDKDQLNGLGFSMTEDTIYMGAYKEGKY
jgi:hypothetical protein